MTPPRDTASDPLAKDHNAYLMAALKWPHRCFRWIAIWSTPLALLVLFVMPGPSAELSITFTCLFMFSMFISGAWGRWQILRAWPRDHPWRAWAGPSFVMCLVAGLFTSLLPARFVYLTLTAPFQWRTDVIIEHDARYDVAAELISLYGPEVAEVIPEFDGRTRKRTRLRLGETTPRSGMLSVMIIGKRGGNEFLEKLGALKGRDDYPSQAIIEREGVYREAAGQCVFPLHKPLPRDYQDYLTRELEVQFGVFEGQPVVFGKDWIYPNESKEGEPCYNDWEYYAAGIPYAVFAALSYPYLYFRNDLYRFDAEDRRYYDFSWSNLLDNWDRII
ncbi:hypothetical protein AAIA72_11600 [Hahella sp. SMD15-11]|uniref:DUF1109 domain-containing protein n=1 Tax=Thermohahella caldifontis TaxID=3142973 RepID=A0AB39UU08_9GAMM